MAEGGLLPPVVVEIKAKISELKAGLGEAKEELEKTAKETEQSSSRMSGAMNKASHYGKALAIGIAGVATTVGGFAVEAATAGEKVDAQLATAIKNAGGSMEDFEPRIKNVDSKLRDFGFTNDQTNDALTRLTVATKDPEKALQAVSVAADLARSRNIPLATATDLVAKAMAGQTGALTRMGINLPIAAGGAQKLIGAQQSLAKAQDAVNAVLKKYPDAANPASKAHAQYEAATKKAADAQKNLQDVQSAGGDVLKALASRVHGAASAYGDTLAGKVASAKAQLENMGEVIGAKLIPIITTLIGWVSNVSDWLGRHKIILIAVATVVGTIVVAAIGLWIASMLTATVTIGAFETTAAPLIGVILLIAAVIAGLVIGIYELVTHWSQVWGAIKAATSAVWDFLKGVFNWIKSIFVDAAGAALHGLEAAWHAVWGGIQAAVSAVWDFLKGVWSWIKTIFVDVVVGYLHMYEAVWSAVWGGIRSVVSGVWGFLQSVWGGITGGVHAVWGVIQQLGGTFSSVFGGIKQAVSDAWGVIKGIFDAITGAVSKVTGAIGGVVHTVGSVAGAIGKFLHFDNGGIVPGPVGAPRLAVVHGGEYVLSNDMLAGKQQPTGLLDGRSTNGYTAASPSQSQQTLTGATGSGGPQVTVIAHTNASPQRIAKQVGWELRAMA